MGSPPPRPSAPVLGQGPGGQAVPGKLACVSYKALSRQTQLEAPSVPHLPPALPRLPSLPPLPGQPVCLPGQPLRPPFLSAARPPSGRQRVRKSRGGEAPPWACPI